MVKRGWAKKGGRKPPPPLPLEIAEMNKGGRYKAACKVDHKGFSSKDKRVYKKPYINDVYREQCVYVQYIYVKCLTFIP